MLLFKSENKLLKQCKMANNHWCFVLFYNMHVYPCLKIFFTPYPTTTDLQHPLKDWKYLPYWNLFKSLTQWIWWMKVEGIFVMAECQWHESLIHTIANCNIWKIQADNNIIFKKVTVCKQNLSNWGMNPNELNTNFGTFLIILDWQSWESVQPKYILLFWFKNLT